MSKYKKVKRRSFLNFNFKFKKVDSASDVPMTSSNSSAEDEQSKKYTTNFKIVSGRKAKTKRNQLIVLFFVLFLVVCILSFSLLSPTGISELVTNYTSSFSLKFDSPNTVSGSELYNVWAKGNYFYLLSDSDIAVYSKMGKISFSVPHGFSSPVLSVADTRCLVYDENSTGIQVYNASKKLFAFDTEKEIYSADICRNGTFAVATKSDSYTSMLTVYNKNLTVMFEWYCPEEIICSVALSANGKQVAVSTVSAKNGKYVSNLYILKYNSADPVFTKTYDGQLIYKIDSKTKNAFYVVKENGIDTVTWKDYTVTEYSTEYSVDNIRSNGKYLITSASRENDDGISEIVLLNQKGTVVSNFTFNGKIADIQVYKKGAIIVSGTTVYLIDSEGNVKKSANCGFGVKRVIAINSSRCIVLTDNTLNIIEFE